jgi:hypothetical protein
MIHYAQSFLLAHLAEAVPRPIPMTPWWVVTFLWCQLHGQLIGTGLHVRTSSFLAVVTRVEFWWCCPCFVAAIFWWNIQLEVPPRVEFHTPPSGGQYHGVWSKWGGIPVLPREKIPPRWNFGNNTGVCWRSKELC